MSDSSYDIDFLQRENPHGRDDRVLFEESYLAKPSVKYAL